MEDEEKSVSRHRCHHLHTHSEMSAPPPAIAEHTKRIVAKASDGQRTIAEALLRLQPKFQKSKVGNWSIYDLFIKVGILGH